MSNTLFDRLFSRAIIQENGCWEYAGSRNEGGYGLIHVMGHTELAHRVAYDLCVDDIPEGMLVLHSCDNPPCVCPSHLFVGTHKDNTQDCLDKGRHVALCGINHPNYRISINDSNNIISLLDKGYSQQWVADEFGVSQVLISQIKLGKHWTTKQNSQF